MPDCWQRKHLQVGQTCHRTAFAVVLLPSHGLLDLWCPICQGDQAERPLEVAPSGCRHLDELG